MIVGHERAVEQFRTAWDSRALHHAWLLAGPRGVGKASFAVAAATRLLADAAGPPVDQQGIGTPDNHPIASLIRAGSHLDFRRLERLPKEKGEGLARNITVKQVRALAELFGVTPALSPWRAVIVDSADDMEASAANALLKMLEEPPPNCLFFLVTHSPGRLLPTIRSRCRRLDFQRLGDDAMMSILERQLPETSAAERARLVELAGGSAGRALALSALDLAPIEQLASTILRDGDPTNERRSKLASELARKGAADRYEAFLSLIPALVAREARALAGAPQQRAVDAYARARELAAIAPRLSLDPAATVFQIGGILASVAEPRLA